MIVEAQFLDSWVQISRALPMIQVGRWCCLAGRVGTKRDPLLSDVQNNRQACFLVEISATTHGLLYKVILAK